MAVGEGAFSTNTFCAGPGDRLLSLKIGVMLADAALLTIAMCTLVLVAQDAWGWLLLYAARGTFV